MIPTRPALAEKIKIMQAEAEGKQTQIWLDFKWVDIAAPSFNWEDNIYRTKPEPREFYLLDETEYVIGCSSKAALNNRYFTKHREVIHVREVL